MDDFETWSIEVVMPDGSTWAVSVETVAVSRAEHFAYEYDDDVERSYDEDTAPLFKQDHSEILDWAVNMDWDDFRDTHCQVLPSPSLDFDEGWEHGEKEVVTG